MAVLALETRNPPTIALVAELFDDSLANDNLSAHALGIIEPVLVTSSAPSSCSGLLKEEWRRSRL